MHVDYLNKNYWGKRREPLLLNSMTGRDVSRSVLVPGWPHATRKCIFTLGANVTLNFELVLCIVDVYYTTHQTTTPT